MFDVCWAEVGKRTSQQFNPLVLLVSAGLEGGKVVKARGKQLPYKQPLPLKGTGKQLPLKGTGKQLPLKGAGKQLPYK